MEGHLVTIFNILQFSNYYIKEPGLIMIKIKGDFFFFVSVILLFTAYDKLKDIAFTCREPMT